MIVVDTSVWASFFNGTRTPHVERLHAAFDNAEDVAIVPVILTEVLQGFRHDLNEPEQPCFEDYER